MHSLKSGSETIYIIKFKLRKSNLLVFGIQRNDSNANDTQEPRQSILWKKLDRLIHGYACNTVHTMSWIHVPVLSGITETFLFKTCLRSKHKLLLKVIGNNSVTAHTYL